MLDSFTILVAGCAVLMLQGLTYGFFWLRDRTQLWLIWWAWPLMFGGAAIVFYLRPGWDTEFVPIAFGNAARMIALGALWQGIRLFQHRKLLLWPLIAILIGWTGLCLVPPFVGSMMARVLTVSLINAGLCALAVHELWRGRAEALPSRMPLLAVFASFGLFMLGRAVVAPFAPFPIGAGALDSTWLGIFVFLVFAHAAFAALLFFSMTRERREAEQRSFALSDPLTGLLNRRAFGDFAQRMSRRRAGMRDAMALLVLDLDRFKLINDRFGHEAGDRMLEAFADVSESSVRPSDQLFRMGGEEFCFVLPDTSIADAIAVAERIRKTFERCEVETGSGPAATTVSIGIAATRYAVDVDVLLAAADAAVYEAKARGRNRVVVAEPSTLVRTEAATAAIRRRA